MTMIFNNRRVKAKTQGSRFTIIKMKEPWTKFNVKVLSDDESMGLVYGSGQYREGTEIQIYAEAKAGYKFARWSDGSTEARRTIIVDQDIELMAYFEQDISIGVLTYIPNKEYVNKQ